MTSGWILSLLVPGETTSINSLALKSGQDPRAVRIALVAAAGQGVVEVDETFMAWRLTPPRDGSAENNRPAL